MADDEIEGKTISLWLRAIGLESAKLLLKGCLIDDGNDTREILDLKNSNGKYIFVCRGSDSDINLHEGKVVYLIDCMTGGRLREAIEQSEPDDLKKIKSQRSELRNLGINPDKVNDGDISLLISAVRDHNLGELPSNETQEVRYEIFKKYELYEIGAVIIQKWRALIEKDGRANPSLCIKHAKLLREGRYFKAAIAATDVLAQKGVPDSQRAILSTIRAAVLLDLFETEHVTVYMIEAEKYAKKAYAIAISKNRKDEEIIALYNRLNSLR